MYRCIEPVQSSTNARSLYTVSLVVGELKTTHQLTLSCHSFVSPLRIEHHMSRLGRDEVASLLSSPSRIDNSTRILWTSRHRQSIPYRCLMTLELKKDLYRCLV